MNAEVLCRVETLERLPRACAKTEPTATRRVENHK